MEFRCGDLRDTGVVLVPSTSPEYEPLLADIQQRIDHPPPETAGMTEIFRRGMVGKIDPEKRPTSAILLNQSGKTIASVDAYWRCEDIRGSVYRTAAVRTGSNLLPFAAPPALLKIMAYWTTIMPDSTRYLGEDGMAGDNTDVRLPAPDEIWKRGGIGGRGGGGMISRFPARSVTLIIDGVFFTDGEFVGPNENELWEDVTIEARTRLAIANAARDGRGRGNTTAEIMDRIEQITGPPPDDPPFLQERQQRQAHEISWQRLHHGDELIVDCLAARADTQLPNFRRR